MTSGNGDPDLLEMREAHLLASSRLHRRERRNIDQCRNERWTLRWATCGGRERSSTHRRRRIARQPSGRPHAANWWLSNCVGAVRSRRLDILGLFCAIVGHHRERADLGCIGFRGVFQL